MTHHASVYWLIATCAFAALSATTACNRPTTDACAAPHDLEAGVDPDGGDAAEAPMVSPSCQGCVELATGVVDQRFAARFAADLLPLVQSQQSGGSPLVNPGALNGAPVGTLLRYAVITRDINAQQTLIDLLEQRVNNIVQRSMDSSNHGDELQQQDDVQVVGDACAALLTLGSADRTVSSRAQGMITNVSAFLRYAEPLQATLFTEDFPAIEKVANFARLFATCGTFAGDPGSAQLGTQWAQVAVGRQGADGAYYDDQGTFDTYRQSYVTLALLDAARGMPTGECSRVLSSIERSANWLAPRVNAQGQLNSSGSRFTCQSGSATVVNPSALFRTLAMADSLSGDVPVMMDLDAGMATDSGADPDADTDGMAPPMDPPMDPPGIGPLGQAALRVTRYVRNNPGAPTCFP